ncbi:hypothetical protein ABID08_000617 [Rhizobium binae]|uniref:Uncharacterized protein n=1 Tax=Rhizobium binae TaxID=1138190 RepID=A0ABV2M9X9_9HYPH|nr:hypothetical protein [Rhizobium binae]NKL51345.1 hypothetical protein [Rhizobium leguminosarum bv. viciae]MBX4953621.1 hypothetical protein [Rhizobium binae]MBX4966069.1 hypothetical protein [Rhizobium binae]MBX4992201.1 hypothetical protein [Rhizobium binae]QSY80825.1 hypothetical protein J2J99_14030 [Rhizobium binae]
MSGEAENNAKTAIVPVQSASLAEQAATAAALEDMQKASLEPLQAAPAPAPAAARFSWHLDPQEMAKLISDLWTLPMVFWSTGQFLAYSLWLSSLPPAAETMDPIGQRMV